MTEKYRPGNGGEGEAFMALWCDKCTLDDGMDGGKICEIIGRAMAFSINEEGYPDEWIKGKDGPECTAFDSDGKPQRCNLTIDLFKIT